mgnify:CR=1 FL=1
MGEIITKESSQPLALFAKKEQIYVPPSMLGEMRVLIPNIFYWEDVENGVSCKMTMAFKMHGRLFGMSYPIEDTNFVKIDMLRKKLFAVVKESLDVLVNHGVKVLDSFGNIDLRLVNEQEAIRFKYDKYWDKKVAAFNQLVRIAPITRAKAIKMKLV